MQCEAARECRGQSQLGSWDDHRRKLAYSRIEESIRVDCPQEEIGVRDVRDGTEREDDRNQY